MAVVKDCTDDDIIQAAVQRADDIIQLYSAPDSTLMITMTLGTSTIDYFYQRQVCNELRTRDHNGGVEWGITISRRSF